MPQNVTADEIKTLLKLKPNATCGFVRETYKSDLSIALGRAGSSCRRAWLRSRPCDD
jgi:predicted cupin superfamily sugar epimerase